MNYSKSVSIIFLFLALLSIACFAQPDLKSLQRMSPQKQLELCMKYTTANEDLDAETTDKFARKAWAIASSLHDSLAMERLCAVFGKIKRYETKYDSSKAWYDQAIKFARARKDTANKADYLNGLALVSRQQGQLQEAIAISLSGLRVATAFNNLRQMGDAYHNLGFVFNTLTNYDSAILYFNKSFTVRNKVKDTLGIAGSYNGLGLVAMRQSKYNEARELYLKSVSFLNEKKHPRLLAQVYNNLGVTYEDQGQFERGRDYYFKSIAIKVRLKDVRGLASTYGNLGDNYRENKNPDKAIEFARLSEKLSRETKSLDYLITATKLMYFAYEMKQDYKQALYYHKTFKHLQDSLYNEKKTRQINELVNKYTLEKKERENATLRTAAALKELDILRGEYIIQGAFVVIIISAGLLIFLYKMYSKSKGLSDQLALQKEEAIASSEKLQEALIENTHMTNIMVHDLRSPMNQVMGLAELMQKEGGLNAHQDTYLAMMKHSVSHGRRVVDDLLTISKKESLHMETLDVNKFLVEFIEEYLGIAEKKNIDLSLTSGNENVLVKTDEEILRRILDNLLSNAIKFSKPHSTVKLHLAQGEKGISISVIDQGPGFTEADRKSLFQKFARLSARPTGGEASTGLGLAIVKHLVDQLDATIKLTSEPHQGATFTVSLPHYDSKK